MWDQLTFWSLDRDEKHYSLKEQPLNMPLGSQNPYAKRAYSILLCSFPGVESRLKPIWFPDVTCSDDATSISTCSPTPPIGYGTCFDVLAVQCSKILT